MPFWVCYIYTESTNMREDLFFFLLGIGEEEEEEEGKDDEDENEDQVFIFVCRYLVGLLNLLYNS